MSSLPKPIAPGQKLRSRNFWDAAPRNALNTTVPQDQPSLGRRLSEKLARPPNEHWKISLNVLSHNPLASLRGFFAFGHRQYRGWPKEPELPFNSYS
jgi:hypothetical protein